MNTFVIVAMLMALVMPSLQQRGRGGYGGQGGQGGHHQGGFQGQGCGYFDVTCRAGPSDYDAVDAYYYDNQNRGCYPIKVYSRCAGNYGASYNLFKYQQDCSTACQYNNGRY